MERTTTTQRGIAPSRGSQTPARTAASPAALLHESTTPASECVARSGQLPGDRELLATWMSPLRLSSAVVIHDLVCGRRRQQLVLTDALAVRLPWRKPLMHMQAVRVQRHSQRHRRPDSVGDALEWGQCQQWCAQSSFAAVGRSISRGHCAVRVWQLHGARQRHQGTLPAVSRCGGKHVCGCTRRTLHLCLARAAPWQRGRVCSRWQPAGDQRWRQRGDVPHRQRWLARRPDAGEAQPLRTCWRPWPCWLYHSPQPCMQAGATLWACS